MGGPLIEVDLPLTDRHGPGIDPKPTLTKGEVEGVEGIICDVRIRRSAGEHRTRLTSANRPLRRHWPPGDLPGRCCGRCWTVAAPDPT